MLLVFDVSGARFNRFGRGSNGFHKGAAKTRQNFFEAGGDPLQGREVKLAPQDLGELQIVLQQSLRRVLSIHLHQLDQPAQIPPHQADGQPQGGDLCSFGTNAIRGGDNAREQVGQGGEVEPEGLGHAAKFALVAFAVRAVAPQDDAGLNQIAEMPPHGRTGHAVQTLADRLVRGKDNHFLRLVQRHGRIEAQQNLKNRQIAVGEVEIGARDREFAQYVPFRDGLCRKRRSRHRLMLQLRSINHPPKRRYRGVTHSNITKTKISRLQNHKDLQFQPVTITLDLLQSKGSREVNALRDLFL